jgi:hypothetical protein
VSAGFAAIVKLLKSAIQAFQGQSLAMQLSRQNYKFFDGVTTRFSGENFRHKNKNFGEIFFSTDFGHKSY